MEKILPLDGSSCLHTDSVVGMVHSGTLADHTIQSIVIIR
jgi:hypothetical protein